MSARLSAGRALLRGKLAVEWSMRARPVSPRRTLAANWRRPDQSAPQCPGCVRSPGIDGSPSESGGPLRALRATASLGSPALSCRTLSNEQVGQIASIIQVLL